MFHRPSKPLSRLLGLLDDVLGDPIDEAEHRNRPHPHRRRLRRRHERRPGMVAARPADCVSPIEPRVYANRALRRFDLIER